MLSDISNTVNASQSKKFDATGFKDIQTNSQKKPTQTLRLPSSIIKHPELIKSSTHVSNSKIIKNKHLHVTPKKLSSPECMKKYVPKLTQSIDRPSFKKGNLPSIEKVGQVTNLIFPTSPLKIRFSEESKNIGGDGSLNRIRAKFKNGLMSPERLRQRDNTAVSTKPRRNLFGEIQKEVDAVSSSTDDRPNLRQSASTSILKTDFKGKKSPSSKTVKFNIPENSYDINTQLTNITNLLQDIVRRQAILEEELKEIKTNNCCNQKS